MKALGAVVLAGLLAAAAAGCGSAGPPTARATGKAQASAAATAHPKSAFAHIVIIMEENHGYWGVVNNADMPYVNWLWLRGETKTGPVLDLPYAFAVAHPSLPNYLAITSGSTWGKAGSDAVHPGEFAGPSLWDQLSAAGISWGVYADGMPVTCWKHGTYQDTAADSVYALRHNPSIVYKSVVGTSECSHVQPLSDLTMSVLPAVTMIIPNLCEDFHGLLPTAAAAAGLTSCVKGSAALTRRSDAWLENLVPKLTAAGADVLIAWDEGGTGGLDGTKGGGGRLAELWTGPGVTPGVNDTQFNDYGVLAAIERAEGLRCLAAACKTPLAPLP